MTSRTYVCLIVLTACLGQGRSGAQVKAAAVDCNFLPALVPLAFDTTVSFDRDTRAWLVFRKVLETEFNSEDQALKLGIDLSFVYQFIPINIKGESDFKRLLEYKKTTMATDLNVG